MVNCLPRAACILAFIFLWGSLCPAQPKSIRFERIAADLGLFQGTVNTITQSRDGFIWIGTQDGLNRFDGYEFKTWAPEPGDPDGLSDGWVTIILESASEQLWIGTGDGLNTFDRERQIFESFKNDPLDPNSLGGNDITEIFEDRTGRLWIGTLYSGLSLFNPETGKCIRYRFNPEDGNSLNDDHVLAIREDRSGRVWVGTATGLNIFDPSSGRFTRLSLGQQGPDGMAEVAINCLFLDKTTAGIMWIGTATRGLYAWNMETGLALNYQAEASKPNSLQNNTVNHIHKDRDGVLWVATEDGLDRFDEKSQRFHHYRNSSTNPRSLSDNFVTEIFEDRTGVLWVGTQYGGINRFLTAPFELFSMEQAAPYHLPDRNVWAVHEDRSGNLWVGAYPGHLTMFDRHAEHLTIFFREPNKPTNISSKGVSVIEEDLDGHLWLGSEDGLQKLDPVTKKVTNYLNDPELPDSLADDYILVIHLDRNGDLWIGTMRGGLDLFERTTGKFKHHQPDPKNPFAISGKEVWCIYEDDIGTLWVGTGAGLNALDRESGHFRSYRHQPNNPASLSNDDVGCIHQDRSGMLWVGTSNGLNKYNPETGIFTRFSKKDGLSNQVIHSILGDGLGFLWMSTNNGLVRMNLARQTFRNYSLFDGLQSNEFNSGASFQSKSGELFFGGVNGVTSFFPAQVIDDSHPPQMAITDLFIFNKPASIKHLDPSSPLERPISKTDEVVLSYQSNVFSLSFVGMHYANLQANSNAYRLEGEDWVHANARQRIVTYNNLDPGFYTFQVKGCNKDGVWNEEPISLGIRILPPFWKTYWAYLLYVLFVVGLFGAIENVRSRGKQRLLEKNLELEAKNEELETFDGIVRTINRELRFTSLLKTLLHQGRILFPMADRASFLLWDKRAAQFRVAASSGHDISRYENLHFDHGEAVARYTQNAIEIEKSIFLIRDFEGRAGADKVGDHKLPKIMLTMPVTSQQGLLGFLVFDNLSDENALSYSDGKKLVRFREHMRNAITKAHYLQELQEKNKEILLTQKQLIFQEKMSSLAALTAGIAHEIKNPLNFVNNFAEVAIDLSKELQEDLHAAQALMDPAVFASLNASLDDLEQNTSCIYRHGKRANEIISSMIGGADRGGVKPKDGDLNALVDEYSTLTWLNMKPPAEGFMPVILERDLDETLGLVSMVDGDLSRVIINLVSNALDAVTQKQKKGPSDYEPRVRVTTRNEGDTAVIKVADNGRGIDLDHLDHIFNPFFSTKPSGGGYIGMGLAFCYDIVVSRLHGELKAFSEQGNTEFVINLPLK